MGCTHEEPYGCRFKVFSFGPVASETPLNGLALPRLLPRAATLPDCRM